MLKISPSLIINHPADRDLYNRIDDSWTDFSLIITVLQAYHIAFLPTLFLRFFGWRASCSHHTMDFGWYDLDLFLIQQFSEWKIILKTHAFLIGKIFRLYFLDDVSFYYQCCFHYCLEGLFFVHRRLFKLIWQIGFTLTFVTWDF